MVVAYDSDLKRKLNETDNEYIQRLCATKDINKMSWKALSELLNDEFGWNRSES